MRANLAPYKCQCNLVLLARFLIIGFFRWVGVVVEEKGNVGDDSVIRVDICRSIVELGCSVKSSLDDLVLVSQAQIEC